MVYTVTMYLVIIYFVKLCSLFQSEIINIAVMYPVRYTEYWFNIQSGSINIATI